MAHQPIQFSHDVETAIKVTVVTGETERIIFTVPESILVASPTSYQVSIAGTTSNGTAFQSTNTAALTVNRFVKSTTASPLPTGTVGIGYTQDLAAKGGTGQYTWAVTSGALPGGLSLNSSSGQISGQPTAAGPFQFTITATDSDHLPASKAFSMTIDPN